MNKRIFLSPPWMGGNEQVFVDEAFASGYIAPCGPMVDRFERDLAAVAGLPNVCAVSSGTAALDLLFHELGVCSGDRVFCSDLTFVSSIAPAVHRGARPVFIDCDEATWTIDPERLLEALADAAKGGRLPKAVVAVDLYGQCCDYDRIERACEQYGVPLLIDAAEALGAVYRGAASVGAIIAGDVKRPHESNLRGLLRQAGDAGWAAVYSFNGNKIVTTSGGGALASTDKGVIDRARMRAQQAREPVAWYEHKELGYNYRMSNIVAAIGVGQLQNLKRIIEKKRQIFGWYQERLAGAGTVRFMPEAEYGRCTRWLTVVEVAHAVGRGQKAGVGEPRVECASPQNPMSALRNEIQQPSAVIREIIDALERENIESRPVWKPMHLQPVFRNEQVYGGHISERLFENGMCLPSGSGLTENDVDRVCDGFVKALKQSGL